MDALSSSFPRPRALGPRSTAAAVDARTRPLDSFATAARQGSEAPRVSRLGPRPHSELQAVLTYAGNAQTYSPPSPAQHVDTYV